MWIQPWIHVGGKPGPALHRKISSAHPHECAARGAVQLDPTAFKTAPYRQHCIRMSRERSCNTEGRAISMQKWITELPLSSNTTSAQDTPASPVHDLQLRYVTASKRDVFGGCPLDSIQTAALQICLLQCHGIADLPFFCSRLHPRPNIKCMRN